MVSAYTINTLLDGEASADRNAGKTSLRRQTSQYHTAVSTTMTQIGRLQAN